MRIVVDAVDFYYGRNPALIGVNWCLGPGVTGLLGPNGAGKTTLLNLLAGITKPSSGEIRFEEEAGRGPRAANPRVGFVPQRFTLAGEMRVLDTVAYAAWVNGVAARECASRAAAALRTVQLDEQARLRVRKLSGGQRQRLGLAAALAHSPDVVVLDEPTVGLDPGQRLRLREIVAEIGTRHVVLISTHLIEDISHVCERVGVLARGQLVFDGTEEDLARRITDSAPVGMRGSDFERAYYSLIEDLGAGRD